jgi:hypothetical protein
MVVRQRRYSEEALARRGKALYEVQIRPQVESNHSGHVAIDIEIRAFEVAETCWRPQIVC